MMRARSNHSAGTSSIISGCIGERCRPQDSLVFHAVQHRPHALHVAPSETVSARLATRSSGSRSAHAAVPSCAHASSCTRRIAHGPLARTTTRVVRTLALARTHARAAVHTRGLTRECLAGESRSERWACADVWSDAASPEATRFSTHGSLASRATPSFRAHAMSSRPSALSSMETTKASCTESVFALPSSPPWRTATNGAFSSYAHSTVQAFTSPRHVLIPNLVFLIFAVRFII